MGNTPSVDDLRAIGVSHGLAAVGVARVEIFKSTRRDLFDRKASGLHAEMQFTYRNPERATDPGRSLPGAQSLVVGALGYLRSRADVPALGEPAGAVARYAWEDHYADLKEALGHIAQALSGAGYRTRVLTDDNALVDREAAYRAGLGWYGKNANLLLADQGSWFVLGSVLTDADLEPATSIEDRCGPCVRCLTSCPTDAIIEPGVIDANRCLAWLVQASGTFPREHRAALGNRIYGCDDCQEVCPPNRLQERQPVTLLSASERPEVPVLSMLEATDDALLADYRRWYIPKRDPRYLRRNALIVLGNTASPGDARTRGALAAALASDDAMLRAHAVWAAKRLGLDALLVELGDESDPSVLEELGADVDPRY